jgi:hypothetical protein
MADRQPAMATVLDAVVPNVAWAIARDGSLWARDGAGAWLGGCSVPLLAGRALLRSLPVEPGGHCLLSPAHAGLVAAARERVGPVAALFVIQPDLALCRAILSADDIADDIAAGRAWFFAGDRWADALQAALDDHPGLATPTRFVRTRLTTDAEAEPLMADAQRVFGRVADARLAELGRLSPPSIPLDDARTLVVAGSHFRLWDDHAAALAAAVDPRGAVVKYDIDDPLTAAPLALAAAARGCRTVLAADVGRGDASDVLAPAARWITFATRAAVPPWPAAHPGDGLVVADPAWVAPARRAGWPADRVVVGRPPVPAVAPAPATAVLSLIADLVPLGVPAGVESYSSQRLLWEHIAAELLDDPCHVTDPASYLASRAEQLGIDPGQLDAPLFVAGLILPAFAQGMARALLRAGLPLRVWGTGWDALPEFHGIAGGPLTSAEQLAAVVLTSTVLVRPTPGTEWHPVDGAGRPVLVPRGRTAAQVIADAARLLFAPPTPMVPDGVPTLAAAVASLCGGRHGQRCK